MDNEQLITAAKKMLDRETEVAIARATEEILCAKARLEEQLSLLAVAKAPADMLEWYVKTDGRVWSSKKKWLGNNRSIYISADGHYILDQGEFRLTPGLYRFFLIAIPEEPTYDKNGMGQDDYKYPIPPKPK